MRDITKDNLEQHMLEAIPKLLKMARELSFNDISDNCLFILSEITHSLLDSRQERFLEKLENDRKIPVPFKEIIPQLLALYYDLHDINLYVYLSKPGFTVIVIRYYRRSCLDENYRSKLIGRGPMLHCKVAIPPGYSGNKKPFNINWYYSEEYLQ